MPLDPSYANAISSIESGGKYDIMGPATSSGDQAYGKYQIMGANIPQWSKEILGKELTPQEFLANPQAQDAVFQGKFGQYVEKYGPEGAAQAWIGGPGGVGKLDRKDSLGTSIGAYGKKFMLALGQPPMQQPIPQPSQQVPAPGTAPMLSYGQGPNNAPAASPEAPQTQPDPFSAQMPQLAALPMMGLPRRPANLKQLLASLHRA